MSTLKNGDRCADCKHCKVWSSVGKASSAKEAMNKADAWLSNK